MGFFPRVAIAYLPTAVRSLVAALNHLEAARESWGLAFSLPIRAYSDRPARDARRDGAHLAKYRHAKRTMWKSASIDPHAPEGPSLPRGFLRRRNATGSSS